MHTDQTEDYLRERGIYSLVADLTVESPEINELLRQLGNSDGAIPFFAVVPGNGQPPVTFSTIASSSGLIGVVDQAPGAPDGGARSVAYWGIATPILLLHASGLVPFRVVPQSPRVA